MNRIVKSIVASSFVFFAPLALACDYPAPPKDLPNGDTATKDEMLEGVKLISAYQNDMTTYLSCIEADEIVAAQALAEDDVAGKEQRQLMFEKKYNSAVEEQTKTVEEFNAQIRAYKAKSD